MPRSIFPSAIRESPCFSGEFLLGQLPIQPQPGDIRGNVLFTSHRFSSWDI